MAYWLTLVPKGGVPALEESLFCEASLQSVMFGLSVSTAAVTLPEGRAAIPSAN